MSVLGRSLLSGPRTTCYFSVTPPSAPKAGTADRTTEKSQYEILHCALAFKVPPLYSSNLISCFNEVRADDLVSVPQFSDSILK